MATIIIGCAAMVVIGTIWLWSVLSDLNGL